MEKMIKNKKLIYGVIIAIIIIGIIVTCVLKLNFSLTYSKNTRINIYIGKEYNLNDIKNISEEVFGTKQIKYQEIEKFNEAVSIIVKDASDEQIENLKTKIQEKYNLENIDEQIKTTQIGNYRGRDIIKPYIIPMFIVTIIILAYVGVRYMSLGVYKTIFTLLIRLIASEALLLSIIAIVRIPISIYTMPVAIELYIFVTMLTISGYQKKIEKMIAEENKK